MTFLLTIRLIVKVLCIVLLCFLTSFVVLFGKNGTGIKKDFAFVSAILVATLVVT